MPKYVPETAPATGPARSTRGSRALRPAQEPHKAPSSACATRHSSRRVQSHASRCASRRAHRRARGWPGRRCRTRSESSPMPELGWVDWVAPRVMTSMIHKLPVAGRGSATTRANRVCRSSPGHCARRVRVGPMPAAGRTREVSPTRGPQSGGPWSPRSGAPELFGRMTWAPHRQSRAAAPGRGDQGR